MKYYSLDDIILYLDCPLKREFYSKDKKSIPYYSDERTNITYALKDTYIKHYQMYGLRSPWGVGSSLGFFSKRLLDYKGLTESYQKKYVNTIDLTYEARESIFNIESILEKNYEIVATNYLIERSFKDYTITDIVDLIFYNKKENIIEVIYLDTSYYKNSSIDFSTVLRMCIANSVLRRELIGYESNLRYTQYHMISQQKYNVKLLREYKINYLKIIKSTCKSIDMSFYYPKTNKDSCRNCLYNNDCAWSIT